MIFWFYYFYSIEKNLFNRTTSYIVSKSGAFKLLMYSCGYINIPADDLICHRYLVGDDFNIYVPLNYIFHEPENTVSTIKKIDNNESI